MLDLTDRVLAGLLKLKDRLRLVEVPCNWNPKFRIESVAGPLHVMPMDDWLACRFEDVAAASKHFVIHTIQQGRLNPFSGKWNWHWFDHMPEYCQEPTRVNMEAGVDNMLEAFAAEVEKLLIPLEA
jgi:hypothetical protein